jgi:hypothetical protein
MSSTNSEGKWNIGQPGGPAGPFWSVLKPSGIIIAVQVPRRETAEVIASIPLYWATIRAAEALDTAVNDPKSEFHKIVEKSRVLRGYLDRLGDYFEGDV